MKFFKYFDVFEEKNAKFWKMNVTLQILDVFLSKISLKNFPGDSIKNFTVNDIFFENAKKIHKDSENSKK